MNRQYFKWVVFLAVASVFLVALFMTTENRKRVQVNPSYVVPRLISPYQSYISALGVVEASGGNVYIGSPSSRMIEKIDVKVGQKVKKYDILFQLDAHDLKADLNSRISEYNNAVAQLKKLEALPRSEDLAAAAAQVKTAQVQYDLARSEYQRVNGLQRNGAMSDEAVNRRRFAHDEAEAKLQVAEAELNKTKAGSWPPDLEIARLQVLQSKALIDRVETDIDHTIIRSPTEATILQIKIHEGEYPPSDLSMTPAMIIGNTDTMYLRVSINQFDAPYFNQNAPAVAYLQGNSEIGFPLKFIQIEPLLVNKQTLNNNISEKVDTRVLQAIYCFEEGENRIYVGQLMDVFIETKTTPMEKK